MAEQIYMTSAEFAELARTSPETVRYWRHIGRGPRGFKVGRRVLYVAEEVRSWLDQARAEQAGSGRA